jgi:hypothetical protein
MQAAQEKGRLDTSDPGIPAVEDADHNTAAMRAEARTTSMRHVPNGGPLAADYG